MVEIAGFQVANNDDIEPLTDVGGSAFDRPQLKRVNLTPFIAGEEDDVMLRFFWDGAINGPAMNYISYGWFIDDVKIVEGHSYDSDIQAHFFRAGLDDDF